MAYSGTGYIGSFTALVLLENGYDVVIVDNLYNSSVVALDRIELICGRRPEFFKVDVTDEAALDNVFKQTPGIDSVVHFAALKVRILPAVFIAMPVSSQAVLECGAGSRPDAVTQR